MSSYLKQNFPAMTKAINKDINSLISGSINLDSELPIIVQFLVEELEETHFDYRRFKLYRYLTQHLRARVLPIVCTTFNKAIESQGIAEAMNLFSEIFCKAKYFIISSPRGVEHIIHLIPDDATIFYDKTDMWGIEIPEIIERTTKITCSSLYIYNDLLQYTKPVKLITNGAETDTWSISASEHQPNTLLFVGYNLAKLDLVKLILTAEQYPKINFKVLYKKHHKKNNILLSQLTNTLSWPDNISFYDNRPYKDILQLMSSCSGGFVFYAHSDFAQGMFSLKAWDYLKCKIPFFYSNSINYADFDGKFCFDIDKYNIEDVLKTWKYTEEFDKLLEENSWENKFKELISFYELDHLIV